VVGAPTAVRLNPGEGRPVRSAARLCGGGSDVREGAEEAAAVGCGGVLGR
jgi:hypothetical protein